MRNACPAWLPVYMYPFVVALGTDYAEDDGEMNTGYLIYQAKRTRSGAEQRDIDRSGARSAEPIALDRQPAFVWRRIAGGA